MVGTNAGWRLAASAWRRSAKVWTIFIVVVASCLGARVRACRTSLADQSELYRVGKLSRQACSPAVLRIDGEAAILDGAHI